MASALLIATRALPRGSRQRYTGRGCAPRGAAARGGGACCISMRRSRLDDSTRLRRVSGMPRAVAGRLYAGGSAGRTPGGPRQRKCGRRDSQRVASRFAQAQDARSAARPALPVSALVQLDVALADDLERSAMPRDDSSRAALARAAWSCRAELSRRGDGVRTPRAGWSACGAGRFRGRRRAIRVTDSCRGAPRRRPSGRGRGFSATITVAGARTDARSSERALRERENMPPPAHPISQ